MSPTSTRVQAHKSEGVGLSFPERKSDCTGIAPSWRPFQINICDQDDPVVDPVPTARHRELPDAAPIPWTPE